jgi:hypothetical protein
MRALSERLRSLNSGSQRPQAIRTLKDFVQMDCEPVVLRHCHATLLDAVGAPLGTIQALLGHASSEVTRQINLHAIPAEQRRAVEGVEKLLIGPKWTQIGEVAQRPN